MNAFRFRWLLLLGPLALGSVLFADPPAANPPPPPAGKKPRLAVLVVFDQMRGDYVDKWRPLFGPDGFARVQKDGVWFTNCHYPYATTATGPGHASMLSGCSPDRHGIVGNEWYDRAAAEDVYCAGMPRYERVPPVPAAPEKKPAGDTPKKKARGSGSPERMLAPTLGDAVKKETGGKGRVVSLSLKDRSAVLPAGKRPDACYWFATGDGQFVTSTYYRDTVHPWVAAFNRGRSADRWFGKDWTRLRPELDYEKHSGPDDVAAEGKGTGQGRTFPHPMDGGKKQLGKAYYEALTASPFGNTLLLDLAEQAIAAEQLGRRDVPDLLSISFSSNDLVGHVWGPDSQEVLDTTLRSDLIVRDLLALLDKQVGRGNYVVAITADHGICPLPEVAAKQGKDAKRVLPLTMLGGAEAHLKKTFGAPDDTKTRYIEAVSPPWLYLNERLLTARGLKSAAVAKSLADWLAEQPSVYAAYTRARLQGKPADDAVARRMQKSFYAGRAGDVGIVLKPYYLLSAGLTGTNHGTPHAYDTHVPLMVYGPGVTGGARAEAVTPQAAAAILARALGVPAPAKAEAPVPTALLPTK